MIGIVFLGFALGIANILSHVESLTADRDRHQADTTHWHREWRGAMDTAERYRLALAAEVRGRAADRRPTPTDMAGRLRWKELVA